MYIKRNLLRLLCSNITREEGKHGSQAIGVDSLLSYPVKVEERRCCVGREPRDERTVRSSWNSEVSGTNTRSNGLQRAREEEPA